MEIKTRDEARKAISDFGITTDNVTKPQISLLMSCLRSQFAKAPNYKGTMRLIERKPTAYLNMRTRSWDKRECVSFNRDGFIGFAGWADDKNIVPILNAVGDWLETLKANAGGEK